MKCAYPDFFYEKRLWRRGFRVVVGADEVGRGAWAGPVVAGAVVFAPASQIQNAKFKIIERVGINDSKKLTAKKREELAKFIKENALSWGVGEAPVFVINRLGIGKATKIAFRKAIAECNLKLEVESGKKIDFLLVDAFYVPYTRGIKRKNQLAIVKGDERSISIAAASIIAKVYRDSLMRKLSQKHPVYRWERNKGYGTREHRGAIRKYGITRLHRKAFVSRVRTSSLSLEDV